MSVQSYFYNKIKKGILHYFSYWGLKEQTKWQGSAVNVLIFLSNVREDSSNPYPPDNTLLTRVFKETDH